MIEIALVDDKRDVRDNIQGIIRKSGKPFQLVAFFEEPEPAIQELPKLRPDILLVDILLGKKSGVDCVRILSPLLPTTGIAMLTISEKRIHLFESLRAGAHGYIVKRHFEEKLISFIENFPRGGSELSPSVARMVVEYLRKEGEDPAVIDRLTPREEAVLRAISRGASNKEVAEELGIEVVTVETHLRNIYPKLHVHSRREAARKLRSG